MTWVPFVAFGVAASVGGVVGSALAFHADLLRRPVQPMVRGVSIRLRPRVSPAAGVVCALVPLAAAAFSEASVPAAAATLIGWLMIGIAVYDQRTLMIPHALWVAGIAAGIGSGWLSGGWHGAASRAIAAFAFAAGLWCASLVANAVAGRGAMGAADVGVIGFVGAVCGIELGADVILAGALAGLAMLVTPRSRPFGPWIAMGGTLAAAGAAAFGGAAGAATAALALVLLREPPQGSSTESARRVPFGACLVLGMFIVVLVGAAPQSTSSPITRDIVLRHLTAAGR